MAIVTIRNEDSINVAMKIILHAGNARNICNDALKEARKGHFEATDNLMEKAKKEINLAHQAQTKLIQGEAKGEQTEISLLFIHAQDTLMTIMSELNMSKEMIALYRLIFKERGTVK